MSDSRLIDITLASVELTDRILGSGSYGEVMEVRLNRLKCAGKKLHNQFFLESTFTEQQATRDRFVDECICLSKLRHPNIVQLIGVYLMKETQLPMMVMELLPMSLSQCLERHKQIPGCMKASILCDVSLGLLYMHSQTQPLIHRDLTANNVLLTSNMSAKLADLGVAKIVNLNPAQLTTRMTIAPGTPAYMPPEALSDRPQYNEKLDIFSFGNLILHVYAHQWPIPSPIFTADPSNPSKQMPRTEIQRRQLYLDMIDRSPLQGLVERCLQDLPTQRPTATAIVEEMEDLRRSDPVPFSSVLDVVVENMDLREQLEQKDSTICMLRKKLENIHSVVGTSLAVVVPEQHGVQWAVQGKETSFNIAAIKDGSSINLPPVSAFSCLLTSCSSSWSASCSISEVDAGKYKVTYSPACSGLHQLQVLLGGRDISNSPFAVQVFTSGQPVRTINRLNGPRGITIAKSGDVIFAESYSHCVKIRRGDRLISSIGSQGTKQGLFFKPHGVAVTSNNYILVTDCHNHRIQQFAMNGECIKVIGCKGKEPLQFMHPRGINIHPSGKVLIAECTGDCIQVLNPDLSYSHRMGGRGTAGQFQYPYDVACDRQGMVYIADSWNNCIHKFTVDGVPVIKFGSKGSGEGELSEPSSIAIDSRDFVYVTEKQNHRLSIFTCSGEFLHSFGSKGRAFGQFINPCGVAVDGDGQLYICNTDNGRIDVF